LRTVREGRSRAGSAAGSGWTALPTRRSIMMMMMRATAMLLLVAWSSFVGAAVVAVPVQRLGIHHHHLGREEEAVRLLISKDPRCRKARRWLGFHLQAPRRRRAIITVVWLRPCSWRAAAKNKRSLRAARRPANRKPARESEKMHEIRIRVGRPLERARRASQIAPHSLSDPGSVAQITRLSPSAPALGSRDFGHQGETRGADPSPPFGEMATNGTFPG
jgi:hypothetical protein